MTGTLRVTRVPYDGDSAEFDEAVATLDEHAGCYPTKGELKVSKCNQPEENPGFQQLRRLRSYARGTLAV